jgi:hypothetical protein
MIINNKGQYADLKIRLDRNKRILTAILIMLPIIQFTLILLGYYLSKTTDTEQDIRDELRPLYLFIIVSESIQIILFQYFGIKLLNCIKNYSLVTYKKSKCKVSHIG